MTTNESLIAWFNAQNAWINDAIDTYYKNGEFTEEDIKRFAEDCINEIQGHKNVVDISSYNLLSRDSKKNFVIKNINNVHGVNALTPNKSLDFAEKGITVIYGENGVGKSGYTRIFKILANAKYKEKLKGNVYSETNEPQSCNVTLVSDGVETNYSCNLSIDGEHKILRDIDIFDTQISTAYINDANKASFEPWILSLFSELAAIAPKIKNEIEQRKDSLDKHEIVIPEDIQDTNIGKTLLAITEKTKFEDSFFEWSPSDENLLSEKISEANIEAINTNINRLDKEIRQIDSLSEYLKSFIKFFSSDEVKKLDESYLNWKEAEKALSTVQAIFTESATEIDKESVSLAIWKSLWSDAKEYYDTYLSGKGIVRYTEENGVCPLCLQEISDKDHAHRMKSIDEFINGNISKKTEESKAEYFSLLRKCPPSMEKEHMNLIIDNCGIEDKREKIIKCTEEISSISKSIHSGNDDYVKVETINVDSIVELLDSCYKDKETEKQKNTELLNDEDHHKIINEISDLKARQFASSIKELVEKRIVYLKTYNSLTEAGKLTATNKLSSKSKELNEELITEDYVKRFNKELTLLTKGKVKAELKQQGASKGSIPFRITLKDAKDSTANPKDIFSEGEKRAVSLAAFFAESFGRTIECPLVIDDPISSLDLKYEECVINRLVEAAKARQVIVFTHRLTLLVGLCDKCEKDSVPFSECELLGRGKEKGVPSESAHNAGKSLSKLKDLKNTEIAKLKKLDENSDDYIEKMHYICQQIRIHVEKSVEDYLLNGIVLRYRKEVQTYNRISWLSKITEDDCQIIDDMMTKYSYYDHSMSEELPLQEFTLEEVEEDLDRLIKWIEEVKKRQK